MNLWERVENDNGENEVRKVCVCVCVCGSEWEDVCVCSKRETYEDGREREFMRGAAEERASNTCQKTLNQNHFTATFREPFAFLLPSSFITKRSAVNHHFHISGRNIPPIWSGSYRRGKYSPAPKNLFYGGYSSGFGVKLNDVIRNISVS